MTAEKLLGQQLGPYYLESILGSGGMAVVYRARPKHGQMVALKVLFPPPGAGPEILARFEREAHTAARLKHPAIVTVVDVGRAEGYAYMAMPLVEGQTLADRLAVSGSLEEATAADIAWQIADALYYAHSRGVVHRDVKPSNILLTPAGRALLTDFGVAQALDETALTRTGHTVGTPAYMAPEQAAGDRMVDARADLYSLGVVLYHMITGRPPFQGATPQVLHAHVYSAPPPPSTLVPVSPGMEAIILTALAKNVAERFQTGAAMAQALARLGGPTGTEFMAALPGANRQKRLAGGWLWLLLALPVAALVFWELSPLLLDEEASPPLPTSPTATAPAAAEAPLPIPTSSPTPSLPPPTPSPTSTLPATVTPRPAMSPTFTPVPVIPTPPLPTSSPTPLPSATPCPQPVDPALAAFVENRAFGERLGCPRAEAIATAAAWQPFQQGLMLWREDLSLIYGLQADGTWFFAGDTWREGDPFYDPTIAAPDGLYQPVSGFGKVWRERPGARDIFGWATAEEEGFTATIQEFTGGAVWQGANPGVYYILFNNGEYQLESPE